MNTRRNFIKTSVALTAGSVMMGFRWPASTENILTFDLHSHPGAFFAKGFEAYATEEAMAKTVGEMKTGKLTGAFFSMVTDSKVIKLGPDGVKPSGTFAPGEAWADYKRQLGILNEMIAANSNLAKAVKAVDLDKNFKSGKTAAFFACEGGDALEGDAGKLEEMYADGVRSVQIVHYRPNELGDLQTSPAQHDGLSAAGKDVVRRMNKLGMVIDVAHASFETVKQVAVLTTAPLILSHSMLTVESDHPIVRRTISKEHAKLIAGTGGVIGMWPCGLNTSFDHFVENTLRLVDAAGVEHVGLGTDMDGNFKPVFSSYNQLSEWTQALRAKGLSEEEMQKVAGGNIKRVLEKVLA